MFVGHGSGARVLVFSVNVAGAREMLRSHGRTLVAQ